MKKKKAGIVIGIVVIAAIAAAGGIYASGILKGVGGSSSDKVYVQSVSSIMGQGISGTNRYSGVIEPQKSWSVNKDDSRTVAEVYVEVGDEVSEGDKLFAYDVDELALQMEQQKLEMENIDNEISGFQTQIKDLQTEKAAAPADQQFEYTTQIQTLETQIKQSEYEKKSKEAELKKTEDIMNNSEVKSQISGIVKSINNGNGSGSYDSSEDSQAFITVLATGEYRVKGIVNEQNRDMIYPDEPVIIRSRVDEEQTWSGKITKIDTENTVSSSSDSYVVSDSGGDDTTTSTKYPFYVEIDSMDGLILGQHVYIEPDLGQQETKEGVWLYGSYLVMDGEDAYVWMANDKNKLVKQKVELGEHDEDMDEYEITSGLANEDMIAFPMTGLYEGVTTVTNADEVDYDSPLYQQQDTEMLPDDEMLYDTEMLPGDEMLYDTEFGGGVTEMINYSESDETMPEDAAPVDEAVPDAEAEVAE